MYQTMTTLVFDLDGTLYVNHDLGREIDRVACDYIAGLKGTGIEAAADLISESRQRLSAASGFDTTLSHAITDLGGSIVALHRRFAAEVRPERFLSRDDRVVELMRILSGRFELHVYTNNNRYLAKTIMELLGIAGFMGQLFSIEYSWCPKPHLQSLEMVLRAIGKTAVECLFVGDRFDVDLRLPAALGCGVCLVGGIDELLHLAKLVNEENL